jgi:hypothetical protein
MLRAHAVRRAVGIAWRQVALLNSTVQPRPRAGHAAVLSTNSSLQLSLLGALRRACVPAYITR